MKFPPDLYPQWGFVGSHQTWGFRAPSPLSLSLHLIQRERTCTQNGNLWVSTHYMGGFKLSLPSHSLPLSSTPLCTSTCLSGQHTRTTYMYIYICKNYIYIYISLYVLESYFLGHFFAFLKVRSCTTVFSKISFLQQPEAK